MPNTVEISTLDDALAWGDSWRDHAMRLQRENERLRRELGMQRTFADVFGDAWNEDHYGGVPF